MIKLNVKSSQLSTNKKKEYNSVGSICSVESVGSIGRKHKFKLDLAGSTTFKKALK